MLRKTVIALDKSVDRVVLILSLLFFLICGYAMFDAVMVYYSANDASVLKYKPKLGEDPAVMREISDDVVAWLTVDDTNIDYPIMQGRSNSEYINKNPYGDYALSGSIFLDTRCDGEFKKDAYYLVYGHHMDYGSMFGALDRYKDKSFFDSHRTGTLTTPDGRVYDVEFFSYIKTLATDNVVFDPAAVKKAETLHKYLKAKAPVYYEPASKDGMVLALSTCQSADTIERMVVFGVMTEKT